MYCCGIDPGIANMAICIVQMQPFEIVYLRKINIFQDLENGCHYKFDNKLSIHMLARFFEAHAAKYFSKVSLFAVESQMTRAMLRVQYGVEGILSRYGRVVPVHPTTVKCYFGTRTGSYKGNKNAAVEYVRSVLSGVNLRRFNGYVAGLNKADDAADAVLMAMYAARHASELAAVQLVPWAPKAPKAKAKRKRRTPAKPKASKRNRTIDEYIK